MPGFVTRPSGHWRLVAPASGLDPPRELADALKDESAGTRASAVVALINFRRGLDPWIPSLLQMIEKDKDPAVREAFRRAAASSILRRYPLPSFPR